MRPLRARAALSDNSRRRCTRKVDLELVSPVGGDYGGRLWIEVKWHDLWNCPWDVAKLALALREGLCDHGMLIAAAPDSEWNKPGAEFFAPATWDMRTDVLDAHRTSWLYAGWSLWAIALAVDRSGWVTVDEDRRARPESRPAHGDTGRVRRCW